MPDFGRRKRICQKERAIMYSNTFFVFPAGNVNLDDYFPQGWAILGLLIFL